MGCVGTLNLKKGIFEEFSNIVMNLYDAFALSLCCAHFHARLHIFQITSIINEALMIPDGQNELRKLQLRELALLNGTLRPEDLASGARCSNCGSDEHKT